MHATEYKSEFLLHYAIYYEISGAANLRFGNIKNSLNLIIGYTGTAIYSSVPIGLQKLRPAILSLPALVTYRFSGDKPA